VCATELGELRGSGTRMADGSKPKVVDNYFAIGPDWWAAKGAFTIIFYAMEWALAALAGGMFTQLPYLKFEFKF
jgi:hypothetical protein